MPEEVVETNIVKSGQNLIYIVMSRTSDGLTITVRTHPLIEEFMSHIGNGTKRPVDAYEKQWGQVPGGDPIEIYHMNGPLMGDGNFRLDLPGGKLQDENGLYNLSFLRIVGVSTAAGASFKMKGVYSLSRLRDIQENIGKLTKTLFREYIMTTDLAVIVSTQEYNR